MIPRWVFPAVGKMLFHSPLVGEPRLTLVEAYMEGGQFQWRAFQEMVESLAHGKDDASDGIADATGAMRLG